MICRVRQYVGCRQAKFLFSYVIRLRESGAKATCRAYFRGFFPGRFLIKEL